MNINLLYEISAELQSVIRAAEESALENEGEIPDYLDEHISKLEGDRDSLCLDMARLYKNVSTEADAIKSEEIRLKCRRQKSERFAEKIKVILSEYAKGRKIKDSTASIGWRKSKRCDLINESGLDDKFFKIIRSPMLSEIKKAVATGEISEDVARVVEVQNIQVG